MQKITPHLWFDNEAKEAAVFYTSVFADKRGSASGGKDSRVKKTTTIHNTPSGSVDMDLEILRGPAQFLKME